MGITADAIRGNADEPQQFDCTLFAGLSTHLRPMRTQHIHHLRANIEHRIERVHGALEDNGEFTPAESAQLPRGQLQDVHGLHRLRIRRGAVLLFGQCH